MRRAVFESTCGSAAPVDEHVHIGGYAAAADPARARREGYTHVLKLFADDPSYPGGSHRHPGLEYLVVGAADEPDFPLDRHFAECLRFIQRAIGAGGKVLVHCHAGVSRSATIVLLHLMINRGLSLAEAWAHLKAARPVANPNPGFWALLDDVDRRAARIRREGRAPPRPDLAGRPPAADRRAG